MRMTFFNRVLVAKREYKSNLEKFKKDQNKVLVQTSHLQTEKP